MKVVVSLLLGLAVINAVLALAVLAAVNVNWATGIALSIVLSLASVVAAFFTQRQALAWAALLAMPAGVLGSMDAASYTDLTRRPVVRGIRVAEAPAHPEAGAFEFTDGSVRMDQWGKATRQSRSRRDYWAAPIVDDNWTTDTPVTVWAVCEKEYGCTKDWKQPFRAGVLPTAPVSEFLAKAIADAESTRQLVSAPGAVAVMWVPSVDGAVAEVKDRLWFGVELWNGLWIASVVIAGIVGIWRRKPATGAAGDIGPGMGDSR